MSDWTGNDAVLVGSLDDDIISAITAYTYLSVQSSEESSLETNTTANLLYNSASRTQGNLTTFYTLAQEQLTSDITSMEVTLSDSQEWRALAYLIQHYFEQKSRNWDASTIKQGDDSISRGAGTTSGYTNYINLMKSCKSNSAQGVDTTIERHSDDENYPDEFKDSQMEITLIDMSE